MATFGKEEILEIEPNQIRVRLSLTEPAELLPGGELTLALKFEHKDMTLSEYEYLLETISSERSKSSESWFANGATNNVYEFKLAQESNNAFNQLKTILATKSNIKSYHWTVYYYLKNATKAGEKITLDMELKLSEDEEYFYLLKNAKVTVES